MLNVGIHFGKYALYICQYYPGRRGGQPRIDTRRRTNYGLEAWYGVFQGLFPNAYHADSETVEYEALDKVGLQVHSFDSSFFHKMLSEGEEAEASRRIWEKFQSTLRRNYLAEAGESAAVVLHLEAVDFTSAANRFVPWRRTPDRTHELLRLFTELGSHQQGFVDHKSVGEQEVIKGLCSTIPDLSDGDLLVEIGGHQTQVWEIRNGEPQALDKMVGLAELNLTLPVRQQNEEQFRQLAQRIFVPINQVNGYIDEFDRWVDQRLYRPLQKLINTGVSSSHVYVFGEGARLGQRLANSVAVPLTILDEPESARARGAAMFCFNTNQTKKGV